MSLGTMKSDEFTCIVISGDWPVVVVIMFGGNPSIIQSIETYRNMHESVMSQWNKYNTHLHSKASCTSKTFSGFGPKFNGAVKYH